MNEISILVVFLDNTEQVFKGEVQITNLSNPILKISEKLPATQSVLALVEEDTNSINIPFSAIKYWKTLREA